MQPQERQSTPGKAPMPTRDQMAAHEIAMILNKYNCRMEIEQMIKVHANDVTPPPMPPGSVNESDKLNPPKDTPAKPRRKLIH